MSICTPSFRVSRITTSLRAYAIFIGVPPSKGTDMAIKKHLVGEAEENVVRRDLMHK